VARADRDEWAKRVQRWQESGLTAREFADEFGLKATSLSFWKWR
jgi:transposase